MLYFVLNLILAVFLLWLSSFIDSKSKEDSSGIDIVRLIMITAVSAIILSLAILTTILGNERLSEFLGRIFLFVLCVYSTQLFTMLYYFPFAKKGKVVTVIRVLLIIAAGYFAIFGIKSFNCSIESGIAIVGTPLTVAGFELNWYQITTFVFCMLLPTIALLEVIVRIFKFKAKLLKQQLAMVVVSFVCGFLMFMLIQNVAKNIPAYSFLITFVLSAIIILLYNAQSLSSLTDIKTVVHGVFKFIYAYLIECICVGFAFAFLLPLVKTVPVGFLSGTIFVLVVSFLFSDLINRYMRKKNRVRDNDYEKQFEEQLSSLDYDKSSEEITTDLVSIFEKNLDTSFVDILIETQDGKKLSMAYSSNEKEFEISLDNPIFDILLNARRTIVFRGHELTVHALSPIQNELTKLFTDTGADALIILCEGRHVFGMILLGPKRLQNVYTIYDYSVFNRLYSSLFVVGYYMKNIANESIVGTVAREISMSGQIIESIQGNMDLINNPKVDVGYLSIAARSLGGNFVDFIRLTDSRSIIVMGNVSGKGINASMCMVILKSIIRTFLTETKDFKELIQKVNAFIRFNFPKGTFFAGVFTLMDFNDNTLYYINCGVPALFMYNQIYNNVIEIQGDGRILGFMPDVTKLVKVKRVKLNPGDIIMACNEGVFASQSLRGDYFSKDIVQRLILENLSYPADRMAQFVHQNLLDFTSRELENDISLIVMKYLQKETEVVQ